MKLKPLGIKYYRNLGLSVGSAVVGAVSFFSQFPHWEYLALPCLAVWFVCSVRFLDIAMDANFDHYGFFGFRRSDPLHKYEPGDPEYEEEKIYQDSEDEDPD